MAAGAAKTGCAAVARVMRTFSSPSVTSISAMPDSSTKSISFFSLRKSISFPLNQGCGGLTATGFA
ncbi:hypothetical protein HMPREF9016_01333 [Neisseria sp. oral taxon 014 str. F0314]|nr:hypothetical protein HMPREF9016_01333 [Neisseria sp. oral taxon 014 str. F0314]